MNFRKVAKDWLPPAVVDLIRQVRAPRGPGDWEYRAEGWRHVPPDAGGWNVESVRDAQLQTWPEFVRLVEGHGPLGVNHTDLVPNAENHGAHNTVMSFAYVLALAAAGRPAVSFLDWGGGVGHYAVLSRSLLPGTRVDYYCKDLPLLCAAGRTVLPAATFFERDDECAGRTYDLVLASSSLHYSEDWRATLRLLAGMTGRYLYVTRLPVVRQAPSYVVVQRPHSCGYHTEYQGWFLNREELLGAAAGLGLELLREFLIDEHPPVPHAPEPADYRGFLFRTSASV